MNPVTKTLTLDTTDPKISSVVTGLNPGDTLTVVSNDDTSCVLELEPAAAPEAEPTDSGAGAGADDTGGGDMPPAVSALMNKKRA